jgi:hypothetical protein
MPQRIKKNKIVCKKNPAGVGQPLLATVKNLPIKVSVILYVSGLAIKKNINIE